MSKVQTNQASSAQVDAIREKTLSHPMTVRLSLKRLELRALSD